MDASSGEPVTLCGSLSLYPVSLGAAMHNAGYRALGLPWVYVPFAVERDLAGALGGMRALGIRGFGISMPHKQAVLAHCDELSPLARDIGAVNTVVNDGGRLTGHNTDCVGAVRALREALEPRGARCLVIGAGGAGRAVAHGLRDAGARVTIANRDVGKARALAEELGADWVELGALSAGGADAEWAAEIDALVNATSVGMNVEGLSGAPIELPARAPAVVMDIVYKPVETELVRAARARGLRVIPGSRMLLHQAARQFELYTERDAPLEAMEAALTAALEAPTRPKR
jgi:shikimate dehydrogenase